MNTYGSIHYDSLEAEKAVLGTVLFDSLILDEFIEFGVQDWWFRTQFHKNMWNTFIELRGRGDDVDVMTVTIEMHRTKALNQEWGPAYVAKLTRDCGAASAWRTYARSLRGHVKLRRLDTLQTKFKTMLEAGHDAETVLTWLTSEKESIENLVEDPPQTLKSLYEMVFADATRFERPRPVSTGFSKIDNYTGGLYPDDLTVLGGESGVGKTAFLSCIFRNVNREGTPVLLFSLEMGATILAMRILSASSRLPLKNIRDGAVDIERLYEAVKEHSSETFFVNTNTWTMAEVEAVARVMIRTKGIKVVGIDYLQLLGGNRSRQGNREQEISNLGRECKRMAKENHIHVIALSQIDENWKGSNRPPGRGNLRESKALGHHADNVWILYQKGEFVVCNIDKGRNNKTGSVDFGLLGAFTEFVPTNELARPEYYGEDSEPYF
jgi:replicative DNA helicase